MTAIKPSGVDGFLRRPDPSIASLLIYGEEFDAVREVAVRVVKRLAGTLDDPFSVVAISDGDLSGDPGRLADEVQSQSMFGGNRVIWVRDANQNFLKAAAPVLEGQVSGNFIVAEAGSLGRTSPLRQAFEKSARTLIVPLYEADAGEIAGIVEALLADDILQIDQDALHRFIELAGTSRGLVRREIEKLGLYCFGAERVTLADVEAICGNDTGASPDDLVDSVFQGEAAEVDRLFQALIQSGIDAGRILMATLVHNLRLQDFRVAIERGILPEQAIKSARPPVFFKRQRKVQAQLRVWPLAELVKAGTTLATAVMQGRQYAALSEAIANRCLLSLARNGQKLRQEES